MSVWSTAKGYLRIPSNTDFSLKGYTDSCFDEFTFTAEEWATGRFTYEVGVNLEGEIAFKRLQSWFNDIPGKGEITYTIGECK